MQTIDVNRLFAQAERAFVDGRLDGARADLMALRRHAGDHPDVLHLLALVEKKSGRKAEARAAFREAVDLAPRDARLLTNHANLLMEEGESDEALALYDRAVAADPRFAEARYNRALLLQRIGRWRDALESVDTALALVGTDARFHSARAGLLRLLGRTDEAAEAYDRALQLDPHRLVALHGRARVAMERGEEGASAWYRRALERKPGDLELVLGFCEALEAEGEASGLEIMKDMVVRHPDWIAGHEVVARMRSEAGEQEAFADHYVRSLALRREDRDLHFSYWNVLAKAERHGEALSALHAARPWLAEDADLPLMEAIFTSESGDPRGAMAIMDRLGTAEDPRLLFTRGRIALRLGEAEQAARSFEPMVEADPSNIGAWAHLSLAWRLLEDHRHRWLCEQPGLHGTRQLGLSDGELDETAELLRALHRTRAHPIGQSLRGGTQTRGRLFGRREPEIVRLREAILAEVEGHFRELPPEDPRHPLLRHRDGRPGFTGSWSIRLTAQGFHVSHIHPEGVLSSACYISLPESLGDEASRAGWLEIGRPPEPLSLPLGPLASIQPRRGLLALFPSYLFHGTRPFADGERLTVAFDVAA